MKIDIVKLMAMLDKVNRKESITMLAFMPNENTSFTGPQQDYCDTMLEHYRGCKNPTAMDYWPDPAYKLEDGMLEWTCGEGYVAKTAVDDITGFLVCKNDEVYLEIDFRELKTEPDWDELLEVIDNPNVLPFKYHGGKIKLARVGL